MKVTRVLHRLSNKGEGTKSGDAPSVVALLSEEKGLNAAYLKKLFGGKERTVKLKQKVPVHLTYITAWVDEAGSLQTRDDVYGHDRLIEAGFKAS